MADNPRTTPGVKVAFSIAGSDSSGGAGVQAHLKTFAAMNTFGCSAITTITAQNSTGVKHAHHLDPQWIEEQIDAVAGDIDCDATLTGMLATREIIEIVAKAVKRNNLYPLVVDPVMVAKSGDSLIDEAAVKTMTKQLFPLAAIITPNAHEAARLLGHDKPITSVSDANGAARQICIRFGVRACVVKGIRRPTGDEGEAVDVFYDGKEAHELASDWRLTENTHGSGCTFAAAITAALAQGKPIDEAVQAAKSFVAEAIRQATDLGHGRGAVNHLAYLHTSQ